MPGSRARNELGAAGLVDDQLGAAGLVDDQLVDGLICVGSAGPVGAHALIGAHGHVALVADVLGVMTPRWTAEYLWPHVPKPFSTSVLRHHIWKGKR